MGQQVEEIKVEVISKEMVKPSLPPSSLPQTFTQSRLDQLYPPLLMPLLLFYNPPKAAGHQFDVVARLKSSLSQALDCCYPFAGRFLDDSTISCAASAAYNGVPFFETKVHSCLSDVLASSYTLNSLFPELLPPRQTSQGIEPLYISNLIPVSVQVNVFECGGVVLGWYNLHKLFDGACLGTFFKYWSALSANRANQHELDLMKPDFKATVDAFPPLSKGEGERVVVPDLHKDVPRSNTVVKSFKFDIAAITWLKAEAASKAVPTPSRFEALAAFVWQHVMQAAPTANHNNRVLSISVNMRPRMIPPVPKQAMGNILTNVRVVDNHSERTSTLQVLVEDIRTAISQMDCKIKTVYKGEKGVDVLCKERKALLNRLVNPDTGYPYQLNSLCYNGLSDADFGFGIPCWVVPIDSIVFPPARRDFIMFTDYKHPTIASESGIEVWLNLDRLHMNVLESSHDFLSFASPHYSST